jgi:hypothetical protein
MFQVLNLDLKVSLELPQSGIGWPDFTGNCNRIRTQEKQDFIYLLKIAGEGGIR